jgi:hypothetical protein
MERKMSIEEMCKRLRPIIGKKADILYLNYAMTTNMDNKRQIEQTISALYYKNVNESFIADQVLLEPPKQEIIQGEYPLGKVIYSNKVLYDFSLRERDWCRHLCITGMSGSGKTNFAFQILNQLILKDKPILIFDWKKSFRPLMLKDKTIMCFTIGNEQITNNFKININRPPKGVSPREWLNILTDLITESFSASYGVHKLISEVLDKTFKEFGVYEGSDNYPTWHQIKDRLEQKDLDQGNKKTRESEWLVSALRIAHALTFGDFAKVVNHKEKPLINIEDLFNRRIIFEMNSLSNIEKKFFCEYVLSYIYKYKKSNQVGSTNEFEYAILVDEAHNIFLKQKTMFVTESVTDMIYRELREYNTSLICLDQHISKLSDTIVGNSATVVNFQQMLPQDIEISSALMMLKENKKFFTMLPVGNAIVRLAERHYEPFVIKTELAVDKSEGVTDKHVKDRLTMQFSGLARSKRLDNGVDMDRLKYEVDKMNDTLHCDIGLKTDGTQREFEQTMQKIMDYKNDNSITKSSSLNKQQQQFLDFVSKYPHYGTSEIYKALKISARQGNKIKLQLEDLGLVEIEEKRSICGWKKVLRTTPKAAEILVENPFTQGITA